MLRTTLCLGFVAAVPAAGDDLCPAPPRVETGGISAARLSAERDGS